jgi:hypothetical protein
MRLAYDMVLKFPWISVSPKAKYLVLFAAAIRKKRVSQLSAYSNW